MTRLGLGPACCPLCPCSDEGKSDCACSAVESRETNIAPTPPGRPEPVDQQDVSRAVGVLTAASHGEEGEALEPRGKVIEDKPRSGAENHCAE